MSFLQLTDRSDEPIFMNLDKVLYFRKFCGIDPAGGRTRIFFEDEDHDCQPFLVQESMEEIQELLFLRKI